MCSDRKISRGRIKSSLLFESKDFVCSNLLCSNQKLFCVPVMTSRVFQSRHVLCSNQEMSCVPIKRFSRSKTTPFFQDSTRHFSPNFGDRTRILPLRNTRRKNPGTIAKIPPKVACDIFEFRCPKKNSENFFRIRIFFSKLFFEFFDLPLRRGCVAAAATAAPPRRGRGAAAPAGEIQQRR